MAPVQGRFSDLFPPDRIKRKRVLQTIFEKLRAETFRERRTILKQLYRVEYIKEKWTGRITAVGRAVYDETNGDFLGHVIGDSEEIVLALLRAHLPPGFYYVETIYEQIGRILLVGPDTEDDPEDIIHARRHEYLLPVARLANIPAESIGKFLRSVDGAFNSFKFKSNVDAERRKFKNAVRQVETVSNRLLRALGQLDSKGKGHLDTRFATRLQDDPATRWTESQWYLYLAAAQSSVEIAEAKAKQPAIDDHENQIEAPLDDCKRLLEAPLEDFKRQVEALKQAAQQLSTQRTPKLNNKHTKQLIMSILKAVDACGGEELTYNKNKHSGSLSEIYEFFRAKAPAGTWAKLSPATIQRLKEGNRF